MIAISEWEKGLLAWNNIKRQAEIDMEQADLIIPVIEKKIGELKALQEVKNGE